MMLYKQDGTSKRGPRDSFLGSLNDINIIAKRIIQDEDLCKLLINKGKNPKAGVITSQQKANLINNNIRIIPFLEQDETVESYILIQFDNFAPSGTTEQARNNFITIDVICHKDLWLLEDGGLRPYLIMNKIDNILDGSKLTGIGCVNFLAANQLLLSPSLMGFSMVYSTMEIH